MTDPPAAPTRWLKVVKSATAEFWAGTTSRPGESRRRQSVQPANTHDDRAGLLAGRRHPVRLKVEDKADRTRSVETEATTTVANGWETLTFNFANQAPGTAALNLAYTYNKVSIFFNFG